MSKYPNEYAAWRVSFQSDRQAAEHAFDDLIESAHEINQLDIELREYRQRIERLRVAAVQMTDALEVYRAKANEDAWKAVDKAYRALAMAATLAGPHE